MRARAATIVLLAAAVSAAGAPPSLDVPPEVPAPPGDWFVYAPRTDAKSVVYVALDALKAFPSSEAKDPRKLILPPAAAGRYRFVAVASLNDEQAVRPFVVVVGGVTPTPGPTPPTPGPTPPTPDPLPAGDLGLRKASREGAAAVASPLKADEARKLAAAQRAHAAATAAGAFGNNPGLILDGWRTANNAAADKSVWGPWAVPVATLVGQLHRGGKLPSTAAWSAAFLEIAQGLDD